jgi:hypothetical protein
MEACWDQLTGKNCRPYGNTNHIVHQQVLLDLGGGDYCNPPPHNGACPPFHIDNNGDKVSSTNTTHFPYSAYKMYCCPCTSCSECVGLPCCDALSNPNGQSIYKIAPDPVWGEFGFPSNPKETTPSTMSADNGKLWELHVGKLWKHIWFPCMAYGALVFWTKILCSRMLCNEIQKRRKESYTDTQHFACQRMYPRNT